MSAPLSAALVSLPAFVLACVLAGCSGLPDGGGAARRTLPTPRPAGVPISTLQGRGHVSPLAGQHVAGVEGIVLACVERGFWMQSPAALSDEDDGTSEGLFVDCETLPTVRGGELDGLVLRPGDHVLVSGTVVEWRPAGQPATLAQTRLADLDGLVLLARGVPLPTATRLGAGGRELPVQRIHAGVPGGDVEADTDEARAAFDARRNGLDFWESLEGMLVSVARPVAVAPTGRYGEVWVLADDGQGATGRTSRGALARLPGDDNPERIRLDRRLAALPRVDTGTRLLRAADGGDSVTGLVDHAFGTPRVLVLEDLVAAGGGVQPEFVEPAADDLLSVAAFNLQNLAPGSGASRFAELATLIVQNLAAPDLLLLSELQDDSGPRDDGVVSSVVTQQLLREALAAAGGPLYRSLDLPPADGADGGQPGGNIRCALLWREDRGLLFVPRPGGESEDPARAAALVARPDGVPGSRVALVPSPARLAPGHAAFESARKPLAAEFAWRGRPLFVLANHWTSKFGDDTAHGRYQPPRRPSDAVRHAQALVVADFAARLLAVDPDAALIVGGDFNDFGFSAALRELVGTGGLVDTGERLPHTERTTFLYQGQGEQLDHLLVSPLLARPDVLTELRCVHVAADFVRRATDHDPVLARFRLP